MDEESEVEEVPDSEEIVEEIQTHQTEVPPTEGAFGKYLRCLLYTSPSPRDATLSRMPSSA